MPSLVAGVRRWSGRAAGGVCALTAWKDPAILVSRKRKDRTMAHRPNMHRLKDHHELAQRMADNEISCRSLAVLAGCSKFTTAGLWSGRNNVVNEFIARGICLALEAELDELFEPTGRTAWQPNAPLPAPA